MEYLLLVGIILLLIGAGFVLVPLFRDEDDLESFERPRPGTRNLHGPDQDADDRQGSRLSEPDTKKRQDSRLSDPDSQERQSPRLPDPDADERQCPDCGAIIDAQYAYCEVCLARLK